MREKSQKWIQDFEQKNQNCRPLCILIELDPYRVIQLPILLGHPVCFEIIWNHIFSIENNVLNVYF